MDNEQTIVSGLAETPDPPYYAVVFTSQQTEEDPEGYSEMAGRMLELAAQQPGFLGAESARDDTGLGITVSYWESTTAIAAWRRHAEHLVAQELGRDRWYRAFRLRICRVERDRHFPYDQPNVPHNAQADMDKQELIAELKRLRAELAKSDKVDPEMLAQLQSVTAEFEALDDTEKPRPPAEDEEEPYSLHDLLLRFEAEHPHLSETVGRIADGLSRMGI